MAQALDIITGALQLLSVYDPGEALTDADAELGLVVLNDMLDSWSNENLSCYTILTQSTVLTPGQQTYSIGPGGQVNSTRPIRLITGPGAAYIIDLNGNRYGIEVVPENKWNIYGNTSSIVQSNFPDTLWYDPQFPLGYLNFLPWPNAAYTAYWTSYLQLTDFAALNTSVSLPPGYLMALKYNLAVYIKPYFADGNLMPEIALAAQSSKANVKRANMRPLVALYDGAIVSRAGLSYNVYTDRSGSSTVGGG